MSDTICSLHKPWRRWAVTHQLARLLFRLRLFNAIGHDHHGLCRNCLSYVRIGPWVVFDD